MKKMIRLSIATMLAFLVLMPSFAEAAQVHRVSSGESLFTIAQKYGITLNQLTNQNGYLRNHNNLFIGQVIIVPQKQEPKVYVVGQDDTLFKISQKLGVTMGALAAENNITDWNRLSVGQVLKIPTLTTPSKEYTVKRGDTLFKIAEELGVTIKTLGDANNLSNWNVLYVGQVLKVPTVAEPLPQQPQPEANFQQTTASFEKMFPDTFYLRGGAKSNKIALTFDDGPNQKYTNEVLDVLKAYNVPATFFVLGSRVENHPEIINRMVREGHVIGNHTWIHPDLRRVNQSRLISEMQQTEDSIFKITGLRTALMRPPYGAVTQESIDGLRDLDYKVINWSVDSVDWRDQDVDQIMINTLPDVRGGGILLFHDAGGDGQSREGTVASLPELIKTLRHQGYDFVTVDELLNVSAYK